MPETQPVATLLQPEDASKESDEGNKASDWSQVEYAELNRYGRTVYETIFRLAQMTFVINPALCAGFYYVFFEKRETLVDRIGFIALVIPFLGIVYNLGAYGVYAQSHAFMEALMLRIRVIDRSKGSKLYVALEKPAPYGYREYWASRPDKKFGFSDRLTRLFLHLIVAGWIMGLIQAVRLLIPETDTYLASTETLFAGGYLAFAGFCLSLKRWLPKLRRRLTGGKGRGAVSAEESA